MFGGSFGAERGELGGDDDEVAFSPYFAVVPSAFGVLCFAAAAAARIELSIMPAWSSCGCFLGGTFLMGPAAGCKLLLLFTGIAAGGTAVFVLLLFVVVVIGLPGMLVRGGGGRMDGGDPDLGALLLLLLAKLIGEELGETDINLGGDAGSFT